MDNILDHIETLVYIVIFIIAVAASVLGKKNRPEDANGEAQPDPDPAPAPTPRQEPPRQRPRDAAAEAGTGADDAMRKALDEIFQLKTQPQPQQRQHYHEQRQHHHEQRQVEHQKRNIESQTRTNAQPQTKSQTARSTITKEDIEWQRTLTDRKVKEIAKARAAAAASVDALLATADAPTATTQIAGTDSEQNLLAQARNGIIWSEILQPPVSVR